MNILWGPDFREGLDQALRRTLERCLTPELGQSKAFHYEQSESFARSQWPFLPELQAALLPEAEWIFVLEPVKRLPPRQVFASPQPVIAFADLPRGLADADVLRLFSLYDGLVPLSEPAFELFLRLGLPVLQTRWQGIEPDVHRPLFEPGSEPEPLYEVLYLASNPYSSAVSAYETLPAPWKCHYFIATTPAFLPFYFQRCRYVICDDPTLTTRMLEALACGALLICAEGLSGFPSRLQAGKHYLACPPAQTAALIAELEADPERRSQILKAQREALMDFSLSSCFQQLQAELGVKSALLKERVQSRLQGLQTTPLAWQEAEVLTLALSENPLALGILPERLKDRVFARDERYYSLLAANYIRAAYHPLNMTASGPLLQAAAHCLAELSQPLQALQGLVWAWKQQQWGLALHHLHSLPPSPLLSDDFPPLLLCQERLFLNFSTWFAPEEALRLTLKMIEGECLQGLGRWAELREQAQTVLNHTPVAPFYTLYLQALAALQELPALNQAYKEAQSACPLEIPFWLHGAALMGKSHPEQALACLEKGHDLAQRHMMALESVEIFYALERLIWQKHPPDSCEPRRAGYLLWEGAIQSHHSLARINRRLLALLQQDESLYITTLPFHPPEFLEAQPPGDLANHVQLPDVLISHRWPPRLNPPQQGKWVNILPWEHGVLPTVWVQKLNAELDQVWVPSEFVARSFEHSGLLPERIRVIPNGVDTALYHPEGPIWPLSQRKKTVFLFVGGLIQRKGVDLLLKAYAQAFTAADDVALVIKGFGDQGVYSTGSLGETLAFFREHPDAPCLELITRSDLSEADLAALYRACDVYVHPYRGEGFGLPILEAMACGLPVVVPETGPAPEFSSLDSAWYLPTWTHFEWGKALGEVGVTPYYPYYHEVDLPALVRCLQTLAAQPDTLPQKGRAARKAAEAYDWQVMAARIRTEITGLCQPFPPQREVISHAQAAWQQALEAPGAWPQLEDLPVPAVPGAMEPCLPGLQRLLEQCLHTGQTERTKTYLAYALSQGLTLAQYLRLNLPDVGLEKRPLRVHWPEELGFLGNYPESNALLQFLPVPAQTRYQLKVQAEPTAEPSHTWLWLQQPHAPLPVPQAAAAVFFAHPDQRQALQDLGWAAESLLYLPPSVDFEHFHPQSSPLVLEESQGRFSFFSCLDFSQQTDERPIWQSVLEAYLAAFAEPEAVNLIIKPLVKPGGAGFDEALEQVMAWLEQQGHDPEGIPALTFVQEELGRHNLPGLLTGAQIFLEWDPNCDGHWALAAQAAGCKVIAISQYPFLERPFAEQARLNDPEQLRWLLRKAFQQPLTSLKHSGWAVREYLRPDYDLPRWQARIQEFVGRCLLRTHLL